MNDASSSTHMPRLLVRVLMIVAAVLVFVMLGSQRARALDLTPSSAP